VSHELKAVPIAGALQRLARHLQHSALRGWRDWTAERVVLRHRLRRALAHWQHGALAAAFARLRYVTQDGSVILQIERQILYMRCVSRAASTAV
jgi:hypothetical protein